VKETRVGWFTPFPFRLMLRANLRVARIRSLLPRSAHAESATKTGSTPFSVSFFLLALLHFCVYTLLVCESPAQTFLVREQANFEGFSVLTVHAQAQLLLHQSLAVAASLYAALALAQRASETQAHKDLRKDQLHEVTQPPSLNASATDFLGLFAFQPLSNNNSSDSKQGAASASGAHKKAAAFVAACL
jgi:hypothetical protein